MNYSQLLVGELGQLAEVLKFVRLTHLADLDCVEGIELRRRSPSMNLDGLAIQIILTHVVVLSAVLVSRARVGHIFKFKIQLWSNEI